MSPNKFGTVHSPPESVYNLRSSTTKPAIPDKAMAEGIADKSANVDTLCHPPSQNSDRWVGSVIALGNNVPSISISVIIFLIIYSKI